MPKKTSMACHPTGPIPEFRMFPMNWAIRGRPAGGTKEKRHPSGKCTLQKKTQESVHTLEMKVGAALLSLSLFGGVTEHGLFPFVQTTPPANGSR